MENKQVETPAKPKKTFWQIVKFTLISSLVGILQIVLVNVLYFLMKNWQAPLPEFLQGIFSEATVGAGNSNWGYVLPFLLSNLIANIYGYFQNRHTTFKSDAPWYCLAIYIGVMVCLILFSTWLQGVIVNWLTGFGGFWKGAAPTIASACAGTLQMILLFPLEKFVLLKEKKKPAEAAAAEQK